MLYEGFYGKYIKTLAAGAEGILIFFTESSKKLVAVVANVLFGRILLGFE